MPVLGPLLNDVPQLFHETIERIVGAGDGDHVG
jgi:hypothetical protein